jgi:hypothetical protein
MPTVSCTHISGLDISFVDGMTISPSSGVFGSISLYESSTNLKIPFGQSVVE